MESMFTRKSREASETTVTRKGEKIRESLLAVHLRYENRRIQKMLKDDEEQKKLHQEWLVRQRRENKSLPLNTKRKERIKDMLKTLNGLPPYDSWSNICYADGYFSSSIPGREGDKEYDTAMEELIKEFGPKSTWSRFWNKLSWDDGYSKKRKR